MPTIHSLFSGVIDKAIDAIEKTGLPLYTFAFYHDSESHAVSVCADSAENSARVLREMNAYSRPHFIKAVSGSDLSSAKLWQADIGRSLSLGDFARVNIARIGLGTTVIDDEFYLQVIRAVLDKESEVTSLAADPEHLLFTCSGINDDVEFVWSADSK